MGYTFKNGTVSWEDDSAPQISVEMRYDQVYRQQGIRYVSKMVDPKLFPIQDLAEIDLSVLHYFYPDIEGTFGISEDNPWVKNRERRFISMHILDYPDNIKGPTKKKIFNAKLAVKAYHKRNKNIYWGKDQNRMKSFYHKRPWNVIVDYSLMGCRTVFRPNLMKHLFEFQAKYEGYLSGIREYLGYTDRRQLVLFHIPDKLMSIQQLRLASKELKRTYWDLFPGYKELALLDFWKWLDPNTRKESTFDRYIQERQMDRIDILFHYKGHVTLLNLGKLDRWVTGKEELDVQDEPMENDDGELTIESSTARRFQKRFYIFLSKIIEKTKEYEARQVPLNDDKQVQEITRIYDTSSDETLKDEEFTSPEEDDAVIEEDPPEEEEDEKIEEEDPIENENVPLDEQEELNEWGTVPFAHKNKGVQVPHHTTENTNPMEKDKHIHSIFENGQTYRNGNKVGIPKAPEPSKPLNPSQLLDNEGRRELDNYISELGINGMTSREKEHWVKQLESYHRIKIDGKKTLKEFVDEQPSVEFSKEELETLDIPMVTDKAMMNPTLKLKEEKYIKEHLKRDIARNILSVQKAGVAVTDYSVETKRNLGHVVDIHSVQFTPVGGTPTTVKIKVPHIDEDGVATLQATQYRLRSQRVDKPIRKVNDNKVSLTSYYGKLFLNRCERRKFNFDEWMLREVEARVYDGRYKHVIYGHMSTSHPNLPPIITALFSRYQQFTTDKNITIDLKNIRWEKKPDGMIFFGDQVAYRPSMGQWFAHNKPISQEELFGIDEYEGPDVFAEVKILGVKIPVGFILARQFGFANLVSRLGLEPEKYENGKHVEKHAWQMTIRFADEKWIFDKRKMNTTQRLILAGMNNYAREIKTYSVYDFDGKDVYGSVLQSTGVAVRYEREMDLISEMFIDDITRQLLIQMGEPTEMNELWIRAVELLSTSHYVDEINMEDMQIKGYERIAGAVYRCLVSKMREFKSKPVTTKRRFDMPPDDVYLMITKDPAFEIADDINPLQNMKEKSNVTFTGEGGRSRRSMVKHTRSYHETDLGVISEGTVDSADVGITTFMPATPMINSIYGTPDPDRDVSQMTAANVYSAAALCSPFGDSDDGKRQLFSSIQASHRVPIKGAYPTPIRTGYEYAIAHMVDKKFAYVAKADGKIKDKGPKYIIVEYKDHEEIVNIGLQIASSKGNYYRHDLVCDLPQGHKFKKGDVLVFNRSFFVRDILNPTQIILCDRIYSRVALVESNDTFEDSSSISSRLSGELMTTSVKMRTIVVNVTDNLLNPVSVGDYVDVDTELLLIDDAIFEGKTHFDSASTDILRRLSKMAPKAKYKGKVIKVEVFYFADESELSKGLTKLLEMALKDRFTGTKVKVAERRDMTGKINEPLKFGSDFIGQGMAAIRYYIETDVPMGIGDKVVYGNQLKSVIGRTYDDKVETESGKEIHGMFGYQSISARIVGSPEIMGTLHPLLRLATQAALDAYDGK